MNLIVNGKCYIHNQISEKIATLNLFAWLEAQSVYPKVYWKSKNGRQEIAAIGKVLDFAFVPHFDPANISPARFFGGKSSRSLFFLPACEIIQDREETTLVIHTINHGKPIYPSFLLPAKQSFASITKRTDAPNYADWKRIIEDFLANKEIMGLQKIVLARRTTFQMTKPLPPYHLLEKLQQHTSNATFFALQLDPDSAFIGATPEHLYERKGRLVFSEAIAGTRPRGKTETEDNRLKNALLQNEKEKREFYFVKDYIKAALSPLCVSLSETLEDRILQTSTVQHLHAPFHGQLKNETTDEILISHLHPTPAVNGTPKQAALEYLQRVEPFNRGWYASALGWVGHNEAEFAVGIRSALIEGDKIHLYSGGGIVEGSSPPEEWDEREHKIKLFMQVLS